MLHGWEYKIRLSVDDWLGCERIAKPDESFPDEQLEGLARAGSTPLHKAEKELVQRADLLAEHFGRHISREARR